MCIDAKKEKEFTRITFMCKSPVSGEYFGETFGQYENIFRIKNEKNTTTNFCVRNGRKPCIFNGTLSPFQETYVGTVSDIKKVRLFTNPLQNKFKSKVTAKRKQLCQPPPTMAPTPSPTSDCPNAVLEFAVDKSRSIDDKELNKQFKMIQKVISKIDIGENQTRVKFSSFAKNYYEFKGIHNTTDSAIDGLNDFIDKPWEREYFTNFIPIFRNAKELPENSVVVIASDGKPFTVDYKGRKKSIIVTCKSRMKLRKLRPDIKVLCFQSSKQKKVSDFYKCACDGVWLSYKNYDKNVASEQIKNFICSHESNKPTNPCPAVRTRKACRRIERTNSGGIPVTIMDVVSPHCRWKRRKCQVRKNFAPIYQPGDV
jgi:hypothetical protein